MSKTLAHVQLPSHSMQLQTNLASSGPPSHSMLSNTLFLAINQPTHQRCQPTKLATPAMTLYLIEIGQSFDGRTTVAGLNEQLMNHSALFELFLVLSNVVFHSIAVRVQVAFQAWNGSKCFVQLLFDRQS